MWGWVSKKVEGSKVRRLLWTNKKKHKTQHKEIQKTSENESISIQKMTFEKTPGPNGTVITMVSGKAGREYNSSPPE